MSEVKEKYFISYAIPSGSSFTVGCCVIALDGKIKNEEDILFVQKEIAAKNDVEVAIILNYKRMGV